ncbi:hypothetical protein GON26_19030 [Flavobacterium sp. GA093]|uniref:Lipocalin-like domain-containing protein n=1 Tax=Flavobacterium hydrocarbonoxydans TaxID=2683249 RepID=A0A6I4NQI1_9FLAO|nr:DUF6252 family protein [Flavobacterium hydrocarbonoxydans]MWB96463.1 hypothetical protein [Flavobacterium hydrocarbonoxydans]
MKKHFLLLAVLFVSALSFTSCSSDNDDEVADETKAFISYKFNNVSYTYDDPAVATSLNMMIDGMGDGNRRIQLWLPLSVTTGTHAIVNEPSNEDAYGASFYINDASEFYLHGTSGTINITVNNDTKMEGTFTFSGTTDDVNYTVSEGSFRILKD